MIKKIFNSKKLKNLKVFIFTHFKIINYAFAGLFLVAIAIFIFWVSSLKIPEINEGLSGLRESSSTKVYDRTGEIVLFDFYEDTKKTPVSSEMISEYAKKAVVAIEDDEFYNHNGVDFKATMRGIIYSGLSFLNIGNVEVQGGSTITQQVVKNVLLTSEKRIDRKIKEWALAIKLENIKTKEEILTLYLNEIPYGGEIYGIQEASNAFFGKDAIDLTIAESAYLASIINAPTFYSPYGRNKEALENRKNTVINLMHELGYITEEEKESAKQEVVTFKERPKQTIKAPHFVQYIRKYLEEKYGTEVTRNGGLKVITTLDYELQEQAEEIIQRNSIQNQKDWDASNAALVSIENSTGQILSMVGSRDYFEAEIDGSFNVATALRQPGSAFKPFIYARSFEEGYTTETVLFDTRTQFSGSCSATNFSSGGNCYAPENYDGKYLGPITLRNALGQSRNIPAVKLLYLIGVEDAINTARRLGITSLRESASFYGLSLVLGGGEVSLLEMVSAYSTFPNEGIHFKPTAILEIRDSSGQILEQYGPISTKALDTEAARRVSDILSDNQARTPLFGSRSFMYFGDNFSVAAKTGTTNDNRDAWLIGYTDQVTVGVWSGNSDNSPMKRGSSISGKPWREYMDLVNKKYQPGFFNKPLPEPSDLKPVLRGIWQGGRVVKIDTISGKLATELTPPETTKEIIIPEVKNILHWIDKNNPRGEIPEDPTRDGQYARWQVGVDSWLQNNNPNLPIVNIPTETDNVHIQENIPVFNITNPINNTNHNANNDLLINLELIKNTYSISKLNIYLNDNLIHSDIFQNTITIPSSKLINFSGESILTIELIDTVYNRGQKNITLQIDN